MYYLVSALGNFGKNSAFTYEFFEDLPVGAIVEIPVGKKFIGGIVLKKVQKPDFQTRRIIRVVFTTPLPTTLLKLHSWVSDYYATHPAVVWQTILPPDLLKNHKKTSFTEIKSTRKRTKNVFNPHQTSAFNEIIANKSQTTLLRGITGSGKTEIYKKLAKNNLLNQKSTILLVPEISLTSQLVAEFKNNFTDTQIFVAHSQMTPAERFSIWKKVLETNEPIIIIGPRSALFLPIKNLGQIIIDECHEPSYIQDKSPKYNTLRVAAILAKNSGAKLLLGSATPSVSDYFLAKQNKSIVELDKLAIKNAKKPDIFIVNLSDKQNRGKLFPETTISSIENTINAGKQVLIFHNRRGSASFVLCESCGWNAECANCFLPMTPHNDIFKLRCHICNRLEKLPINCQKCASPNILQKGIGTKKIEEELRALFPKSTIARFDGDNKKTDSVAAKYSDLYSGKINIIIGTQTIAKGLDLPNLRLVVIPQADTGLNLPDFSARERTFQLLAQAVGRVGRGDYKSSVIVQTYEPKNEVIKFGISGDYQNFYSYEIKNRQDELFPPFVYLLKLTNSYKSEKTAINNANKLKKEILDKNYKNIIILGPAPAFYERTRDSYHWQITIKSKSRKTLLEITEKLPPQKWQFSIDPINLI